MSEEAIRRTLAKLQQHPLQPLLLADLPADYLDAVERDLRANGLSMPVEILPDNTVVAGWHCVLAAQRLKWNDIQVQVLHDLAEQGEAAVQRYVIVTHLRWRRPDLLEFARLCQRLADFVRQLPRTRHGIYGGRNPLTVMAEWLGASRRNFGRYLRVLTTPVAAQEAFRNGALSLRLADQVAGLPQEVQEGIAARIRDGDDPAEVVHSCLPTKGHRRQSLLYARKLFLKCLRRGLAALEDRVDQIGRLSANDIALLERARTFIGQLLQ